MTVRSSPGAAEPAASRHPLPASPDGAAEAQRVAELARHVLRAEDAHVRMGRDVPLDPAAGRGRRFLVAPLVTRDGRTIGSLVVSGEPPEGWSDADREVLRDLADLAVAQVEQALLTAEYHGNRVRWGLALEAGGIGTWDWDLATGRVDWDENLKAIYGYADEEFVPHIDRALERVHPEDRPGFEATLRATAEAGEDWRAEYRVVRGDGAVRWVNARGRALKDVSGRAVRMLGAAYDVTEERAARDRAAHVLSTMSTGFFALDRQWTFTYLNAEGERILGVGFDEVAGRNVWKAFPGAQEREFGEHYRRAMAGERTSFEAYYPELDAWYEVRAVPARDGIEVYFLDITDRRQARAEAERVAERLDLIAALSHELAETLEPDEVVQRLSRAVVPALADWCLVSLVDEAGALRDVGWWHAEPGMRPVVEEYSRLRVPAATADSFVLQAWRRGEHRLVPRDATATIERLLATEESRHLLRTLAPETALVLPLVARDRAVGLLSLYSGADRDAFEPSDVTTAGEVASRAALALDNAWRYHEQRRMAEELQRRMLTAPPEPDHAQIEVLYQPAAQAAAVGGDWYDAFLQPDGGTVIVVGDVMGHDIEAAAEMGQLRALLRGIGFHSQAGPAQILSGLDAAMEGLLVTSTATAVVARLEQTDEERECGVTRLRWSSAGHPAPLLLTPDGAVTVLETEEPDLLLGIDATTTRTEHVLTVPRESTLILYTDGLVERRGQSIDEGVEELRLAVTELAGLELDELLERLRPARGEDDVALLAVRLHRQDRPRPATAGPNVVPPGVPPEDPPEVPDE